MARPVTRGLSGAQEGAVTINKDGKDNANPQPALTVNTDSRKASENSKTSESSQAAQAKEAQRARQEIPLEAGGRIKFDVEEGNRVLKVLDSKDVLIYQVPPKGALMLIEAQESNQQSQVQTSA